MRLSSSIAYISSLSLLYLSGVFCGEIIYWDHMTYDATGANEAALPLLGVPDRIKLPIDVAVIGRTGDLEADCRTVVLDTTNAVTNLNTADYYDIDGVKQATAVADQNGFRWNTIADDDHHIDTKVFMMRHGAGPGDAGRLLVGKSFKAAHDNRIYIAIDNLPDVANALDDPAAQETTEMMEFIHAIVKNSGYKEIYYGIRGTTLDVTFAIAQKLEDVATQIHIMCNLGHFSTPATFRLDGPQDVVMRTYTDQGGNFIQDVRRDSSLTQQTVYQAKIQLDQDLAAEKAARAADATKAQADAADAKKDLDKKDADLQTANNQKDQLQRDLNDKSDAYDTQAANLKNEKNRADTAETNVTNLQQQLATLQKQPGGNAADTAAQHKQDIADKDAEIARLNGEISKLRANKPEPGKKGTGSEDKPPVAGGDGGPDGPDGPGGPGPAGPTPPVPVPQGPNNKTRNLAGYNLDLIKDVKDNVSANDTNQLSKIGFRVEYSGPINTHVVTALATTTMLHISISLADNNVLYIIPHLVSVRFLVVKQAQKQTEAKTRRLSTRRLAANKKYDDVDKRGATFDSAAKSMIVIIAAASNIEPTSIVRDLKSEFKEDLELSGATTFAVGSGYTWLVGAVAVLVTLVL